MRIAIFGATGFTGKAILREALAQGHEVTVLVRGSSVRPEDHHRLKVLVGQVLDPRDVAATLEGQDAVIQCLGVGGKGDGKPSTFLSDATRVIVAEMEKQGASRLVALSNTGAGDSAAAMPWIFSRLIMPLFMPWLRPILDDKDRMEPIITGSDLDWTIVRCPNILDRKPSGTCKTSPDGRGLRLSISLADMARFTIEELSGRSFNRQAISISN